ncbi:unnamed protein product [Clonostachys solani]|uniref:Uncharacterized protein n=1 Tax=Clonostachys solani TaxID=160281 RepID=A0A9N9VZ84_9HYPO|nr:unnamed protein product [Clonostachys solani]
MIHKVVKFCGSQADVSQKLGDFLCSLKTPTRIMPYSTVRYDYAYLYQMCDITNLDRSISFMVPFKEGQPREAIFSDPLPVATCLPLQIFDCIRAMCNLRSLRLDIDGFSACQESFFFGLLQNIEIQAEHIRISASNRIMSRVLEKSPQLQALHLPIGINIIQFKPVVGRLRRLCAGVGRVKSGGPIQFPTINEVNLKRIAERYQGLEELVLQKRYWNFTDDNEAVVSAFEEEFAKAIKIFKNMPGLKRLAISIEVDVAHSFGYTVAREVRFYKDLLLRLSTCLPRLVQICITNDEDEYWMVTKACPGDLTIHRGIFSPEGVGFPHSVNKGFY